MRTLRLAVFVLGLFVISDSISGQEKTPKKDDSKDSKKEEPTAKFKGQLPQNWGKLGLTDEQKQKVYSIQAKYGDQIDKLELQIKELKDKMSKERLEVLSAEQKKRLQEISKAKTGG